MSQFVKTKCSRMLKEKSMLIRYRYIYNAYISWHWHVSKYCSNYMYLPNSFISFSLIRFFFFVFFHFGAEQPHDFRLTLTIQLFPFTSLTSLIVWFTLFISFSIIVSNWGRWIVMVLNLWSFENIINRCSRSQIQSTRS